MKTNSLEGKVIVVTGGAGLLGHPAARRAPSLLQRYATPALRSPADGRERHAGHRRHELLHGVLPGIDPAGRTEQASLPR